MYLSFFWGSSIQSGIKLSDWKVHISSPMLDIARLLPKELFRQNVIIFPQLCHLLDEGRKIFVNLKGMKLFIFISLLTEVECLLVCILASWFSCCDLLFVSLHFLFGSSVFFITSLKELLLNSRCCGCKTDWLPDISLRGVFGFIVENCSSGCVTLANHVPVSPGKERGTLLWSWKEVEGRL